MHHNQPLGVEKMKHWVAGILMSVICTGCSSMKVTEVDPKTGYFPTSSKATIVTSKPIELDAHKELIVVGNSEFLLGQLRNIKYFGEVITVEELETRIIKAGLTDKVPSLRDKIGLNNAAKNYKPFLWLRYGSRGSDTSEYAQFILTDPITSEDYFVTETHLDHVWAGVNDQNNWYPMFNTLIDYITQNSKTYRK
jgi:hypothetical protein